MLFGNRVPKEAEVLRAVREYLAARRVWHVRTNSGGMKTAEGRWMTFGAVGLPDIQAIYPTGEHRGKLFAIEVKRPGGRLSDGQIAMMKAIRAHGAIALVAEGVEDVERCLADASYVGAERYARVLSTSA